LIRRGARALSSGGQRTSCAGTSGDGSSRIPIRGGGRVALDSGNRVTFLRFDEAVLYEQGHHAPVRLDQRGHIGIVRRFNYADAFGRLLVLQVDLVRMPEEFSEQRVAHTDRPLLFDTLGHGRDVLLNLGGDLQIVGFGQRLDAFLGVFHFAADLLVIRQQVMKDVAVSRKLIFGAIALARPGRAAAETAPLAARARSAAGTAASSSPRRTALCRQLAGDDCYQTQSQHHSPQIFSQIHELFPKL
jgi:hypothetical protein